MHTIGKYLFAVIAVCLLISICKTFIPSKGIVGSVFKLVCGVILASVLISPVTNFPTNDLQSFYGSIHSDAVSITNKGEEIAKAELSNSIEESLKAYICDKASAINLDLDIQILLNNETIPQPKEVRINGNASPYAKKQLIQIICRDLAIGEENIKWY